MRFPLLPVLLVTLAAGLPAAVEQFTLTDGRVFVGEYDDAAGQLSTTIAGKPFALAVAKAQIAEREAYRPKKAPKDPPAAAAAAAGAPVADSKAPMKPMTPEEKAAAARELAYAQKVREADGLDGAAAKATRDAAGARRDAEHNKDQARRDLEKFRIRANLEGVSVGQEPEAMTLFVVLPKTAGNNRATLDAWALAKKAEAHAAELDALALQKHAEADAARNVAASMPHGDR